MSDHKTILDGASVFASVATTVGTIANYIDGTILPILSVISVTLSIAWSAARFWQLYKSKKKQSRFRQIRDKRRAVERAIDGD